MRAQISRFATVDGHVVEQVVVAGPDGPVAEERSRPSIAHVLERAAADRGLAREPPVEIVIRVPVTVDEPREQTRAVERMRRCGFGAGGVEEGRRPIGRDVGLRADLDAVDRGRPAQEERNPDAALGEVALLADERPVARPSFPTVVGTEADDGVVGLPGGVERVEDPSDAGVQRFDEFGVLGQRPVVPIEERQRARHVLGFELRPDPRSDGGVFGALPGPVWGCVVQLEVERPLAVGRDVVGGAVGDHPREVADFLDRGLVLPEIGLSECADVLEVVDGAVEAPEELLEPGPQRAVPGEPATVPLPDHRCVVAGVAEQRRQGRMVVRDAHAVASGAQRFLHSGGESAGVAAGVEADPGRRAPCRAGIGMGEADTARRQPVEGRRVDLRRPEAAEVRPPEIIGQDEDDVRSRVGPTSGSAHERSLVPHGLLVVGHDCCLGGPVVEAGAHHDDLSWTVALGSRGASVPGPLRSTSAHRRGRSRTGGLASTPAIAGLAQLAEHLTCNHVVVGSIPAPGSTKDQRRGLRRLCVRETCGLVPTDCPRAFVNCSVRTRFIVDTVAPVAG